MTKAELMEIALHAAKGTAPANFTVQSVNEAFYAGIDELCKGWTEFQRNKYDIYDIVIRTIDEVQPKRVLDAIGRFADVQFVEDNQKVIFRVNKGRRRAKTFLTAAALSGVYETFRLDRTTFELVTKSVGIGATVDFVRMIEGNESLAEVMDVITEAMSDAVLMEVMKALQAAYSAGDFPPANLATDNKWTPSLMVGVMNTVRAYGDGVVIFATPAFIASMGADVIVASANGNNGVAVQDIEAIHNTGLITIFRGAPIVQIPQSFTDETNTTKVFDDQYAYVFPTGADKVVKVGIEGPTRMWDWTNRDQSIEIMAYKKIGVALLTYYNWGIYQNTSLA